MSDKQTAAPFTADELRLLDQDELELVQMVQPDSLEKLSSSDLTAVLQRLRDRRDRARDLANRQQREARGKVDPSGIAPASQNMGTESKARVLGRALEAVTEERKQRAQAGTDDGAAPSQRDLADQAQALKDAGAQAHVLREDGGPMHPQDPEADPGKGALADQARNIAPSGALDHAGDLPSRERSRTRY